MLKLHLKYLSIGLLFGLSIAAGTAFAAGEVQLVDAFSSVTAYRGPNFQRIAADLTKAAAGLPDMDKLLVAGDARGLYYPRAFYTNSVFDDQVLELLARKEKDGKGIWRGLRKLGVDDLVVVGVEGMRLSKQYSYYDLKTAEWERLNDFIQHHTELIYLRDLNGIYRLRPMPLERKSPIPNLINLFNMLVIKPADETKNKP